MLSDVRGILTVIVISSYCYAIHIFFKHSTQAQFESSLQRGTFPNGIKFARVSQIFKKDEEFLFTNYRPISVLPCFSKLLERLIYNRLYKYLLQNNLLYEKQFGFQASNSTEHVVIQLLSQILDAFNENKYKLGIFVELSKVFDTYRP